MPTNAPPSKQSRIDPHSIAAAAAAGSFPGMVGGGHYQNYSSAWNGSTPNSAGFAPLQQYYS
jgi:hypothetical protein